MSEFGKKNTISQDEYKIFKYIILAYVIILILTIYFSVSIINYLSGEHWTQMERSDFF
jgi:uncharacterized membrane protein YukC